MDFKHPDEIRFEYPDPTPVEIDVSDEVSPNTLQGLIDQARARQALAAQAMIEETYEEADDFDVDDDLPDYHTTKWEIAADAAGMDAETLFERVYGITREQAIAKLAELKAQPSPSAPS